MSRRVWLVFLAHGACTRVAQPDAAGSVPVPSLADSTPPDGSLDAGIASPLPRPCEDGGPPSWVLVSESSQCGAEARLQWLADDGLHQALMIRDAGAERLPMMGTLAFDVPSELAASVRWLGQIPCPGPRPHLDELVELAPSRDGSRYRVKISGSELGGMSCHIDQSTTLSGTVTVDRDGFIIRAELHGVSRVVPHATNPGCGGPSIEPISVIVRRACKP